MAYPDDKPVSLQILDSLQSILSGISKPANRFNVQEVTVFDSGKVLLGQACPAIAIVLESDTYSRSLAGCLAEEREMQVNIFGVLRIVRSDQAWKEELQRLTMDMKFVLAADLKLGGTALYHEPVAEDTFEPGDNSLALVQLTIRVVYRHLTKDPSALSGTS